MNATLARTHFFPRYDVKVTIDFCELGTLRGMHHAAAHEAHPKLTARYLSSPLAGSSRCSPRMPRWIGRRFGWGAHGAVFIAGPLDIRRLRRRLQELVSLLSLSKNHRG